MSTVFSCAIPGCRQPATRMPDGSAGICEPHLSMTPDAQRLRFLTIIRRLNVLRGMWNDEARYDQIVASGRYVKLAHATCCAEEALDQAAHGFHLAIVAAQSAAARAAANGARQSA